jgi:hypothetical protein
MHKKALRSLAAALLFLLTLPVASVLADDPEPSQMSANERKPYINAYPVPGRDERITVSAQDGALWIERGEGRLRLLRLGEDHFLIEGHDEEVYFEDADDAPKRLIVADLLLLEGQEYAAAGQHAKAIASLEKAMHYFPEDLRPPQALAELKAQAYPPWDRLAKGPYDVGFKIAQHHDYSRPYRLDVAPSSDQHARPIRMFIWYPARHRPSDRTFVYGEYVALGDLRSPPWESSAERRQSLHEKLVAAYPDPESLQGILPQLLATPTRAVREAPVAAGRFPLLVLAQGGSTPGYLHAGLGEYLASHGYISVAVPSLPPREGERWPFDQIGIDLHLHDQGLALSHLFTWPSVDRERLGLISWSVGGVSQALLQMRNPDVDAVVSLDSATAYAYGKEMLSASIFFDEKGITVPFFQATGELPGRFEVEKDFSFYESAQEARYFLSLEHLAHADFAAHLLLTRNLMQTASGPASEGYAILIEAVQGFLEAYVRRQAGAEEKLRAFIEDHAR